MNRHETLLDLEHAAWQALSSEGAAPAFYREVLADDVLMLLPGGMVIDDRDTVIQSMGGAPWSSYELADERVYDLGDDSAVVAYRGTATRDGTDYEALFNSTYIRDGRRLEARPPPTDPRLTRPAARSRRAPAAQTTAPLPGSDESVAASAWASRSSPPTSGSSATTARAGREVRATDHHARPFRVLQRDELTRSPDAEHRHGDSRFTQTRRDQVRFGGVDPHELDGFVLELHRFVGSKRRVGPLRLRWRRHIRMLRAEPGRRYRPRATKSPRGGRRR